MWIGTNINRRFACCNPNKKLSAVVFTAVFDVAHIFDKPCFFRKNTNRSVNNSVCWNVAMRFFSTGVFVWIRRNVKRFSVIGNLCIACHKISVNKSVGVVAWTVGNRYSRIAVCSDEIYVHTVAFGFFDYLFGLHSNIISIFIRFFDKAFAEVCIRNHLFFCFFIVFAVHKSPNSRKTCKGIHKDFCINRFFESFDNCLKICVDCFFCALTVFCKKAFAKAEKFISKVAFN